MDVVSRVGQEEAGGPAPKIERTLHLNFGGDWGQANFHRICSWLTQELCDHAGPKSTATICSLPDGGMSAIGRVYDGELDLSIATPNNLLAGALTGEGMFKTVGPMPSLRALAVLPQTDRMMLAVHPKYGVKSWADIHRVKPPLRISTSTDDGTSLIGFLTTKVLEAHGLTKELLESWGGAILTAYRPDQCTDIVVSGEADCLLQEAIMTPWWRNLIEKHGLIPISAEPAALQRLQAELGVQPARIRAGYWGTVQHEVSAVNFSDFSILVRDDMPDDIAQLLTWALVNTRGVLESQYTHIPAERSPLTWPIDPRAMAKSSIPLHPAAQKFYKDAGYL